MKKVLIIEDQQSFASMLETLIRERYQYTSVVAQTLTKAKQALEENPDGFFVVITDINLPDSKAGEGVDLAKSYNLPVLVFTSVYDDGLREDLLTKGVADYLLKNGEYNVDQVVRMVERISKNAQTEVLIVDDSASARTVMRHFLATQSYLCIEAESGEEALAILKNKRPNLKIAIIDSNMKGMCGFELTKEIRIKYDSDCLAVIGISAHGGKPLSAKFIKHGADDFLQKPIEHEEFMCRINRAADRLGLIEELEILNENTNKLVSVAAHDIRSPLAVIIQAIDHLARNQRNLECTKNMYCMIKDSAQHARLLLNNILSSQSINLGKLDVTLTNNSLSEIVQETQGFYELLIHDRSLKLKTELETLNEISVDKMRIRQLIDNLVNNAIKYCPSGSTIKLKTYREKDFHLVEIADDGPGITDQHQINLFSEFDQSSLKPSNSADFSFGLGLSICKSIVNAHNGHIKYLPNSPKGSRFIIYIPNVKQQLTA